jgi:Tfp pilus assembly protein PilN
LSSDEKEKFLESVKNDISESSGSGRDEVLSYFIIGVFVGVVVLAVSFLTIEKTRQSKISSLSQQMQQEVDVPMQSLATEKVQNDEIIKQLSTLTSVLAGRVDYSKLFDDLRGGQYKKSLWTNFALQKDSITITAKADNYADVAKAVAALRQLKAVKDVSLSSASLDKESGKINFTVNISYNPSLYKASARASTSPTSLSATQTPTISTTQ